MRGYTHGSLIQTPNDANNESNMEHKSQTLTSLTKLEYIRELYIAFATPDFSQYRKSTFCHV
jgi:hypothetical protein